MTEELAKILAELQATGQNGLYIFLVACILVCALCIWIIAIQRQAIKKINLISSQSDKRFEEINALRKAASELRGEHLDGQKFSQSLLKDQLDAVLKVNEGFRKDLDRVIAKQDGLRDSIKKSIEIGLQEIKEKLYEVTLNEIVSEIPASFRSDLESELTEASERVVKRILEKLQNTPSELVDIDSVRAIIERSSHDIGKEVVYKLRDMYDDLDFPWPILGRDRRYSDRYFDEMARRIAYHLHHRNW